MQAFLIGLQFLTRIKLVRQELWRDEDFGASVSYFPLVGLIVGLILALVYYAGHFFMSPFLLAVTVVLAEFILTGGLHADGFMDTCDGYFSGRERERALEIMKDSRVGANAVVGFVFLVLFKVGLLAMPLQHPYAILIAMPTVSRWLMTYTVIGFPYARPQGVGKAFARFAPSYALRLATLLLLLPLPVVGWHYFVLIAGGLLWMYGLNRSFVKKFGGVTGDTYGAVTETSELWILLIWVILESAQTWQR
ncbi:MAG: adenosylcobinamide-GDP ribazoletransferase [Veillonellaceae bacterium]|nr:adenosylcobinamide-GDP ribazoletransferase [Veillonellaceae bacterium]